MRVRQGLTGGVHAVTVGTAGEHGEEVEDVEEEVLVCAGHRGDEVFIGCDDFFVVVLVFRCKMVSECLSSLIFFGWVT